MQDLEDRILMLIEDLQDKIIVLIQRKENDLLIDTLKEKDENNRNIKQRLFSQQNIIKKIQDTREIYRKFARRGSTFYFTIDQMNLIDPMYIWSLEYFLSLYKKVIYETTMTKNQELRVQFLIKQLTKKVFQNVSQGLFSKDKLFFSFNLCVKICQSDMLINQQDWKLFLQDQVINDTKDKFLFETNLIDQQKQELLKNLATQNHFFMNILDTFQQKSQFWIEFLQSDHPYLIQTDFINQMQKLTLIKILCYEKIIISVSDFIQETLQDDFNLQSLDLQQTFLDSSSQVPIIFILSKGTEPLTRFMNLANKLQIKESQIKILSLGQGQGQKAIELVTKGQIEGNWIFLQNCHLAVNQLEEIQHLLEKKDDQQIHRKFRLWLSSMPCQNFPQLLLKNGIKITNEKAQSIKIQLNQIYDQLDEQQYESQNLQYKIKFFCLALFHSMVNERRKFGHLGWNSQYDWILNDLTTSIIQINQFGINDQQFKALYYFIGQINYGGRVSDLQDEKLIISILENLLNDQIYNNKGFIYQTFNIPKNLVLYNMKMMIQEMPEEDDCDLFGLDKNANIIQNQLKAKYIYYQITCKNEFDLNC